jgi:hypothetical protein
MASTKVPVTKRALVQRLNRRLRAYGQVLKGTRGRAHHQHPRWLLVDVRHNRLLDSEVDLGALGEHLGALLPYETLV